MEDSEGEFSGPVNSGQIYKGIMSSDQSSKMNRLWKNWTVHNLIAHPLSEIVYLLSFGKAVKVSDMIHDSTVPTHKEGEGRG